MPCPFEDSSASIFNMPKLVQGGTQMVQRKQSVGYTEWFGEILSNKATEVGRGYSSTTAQTNSFYPVLGQHLPHHHHISVMELGHLLTCSICLT